MLKYSCSALSIFICLTWRILKNVELSKEYLLYTVWVTYGIIYSSIHCILIELGRLINIKWCEQNSILKICCCPFRKSFLHMNINSKKKLRPVGDIEISKILSITLLTNKIESQFRFLMRHVDIACNSKAAFFVINLITMSPLLGIKAIF